MEPTRYVVGGHETFPLRAGWLKKGFDAIRKDPFAFQKDDAVVRLGVGKNMVRAIRYWCLAAGVLEEESPGPRSLATRPLRPTPLGESLLADEGWDPYLENPASAWLVHYLLAINHSRATAWWYVFGAYPDNEFTKGQLVAFLASLAEKNGQKVSLVSITRDVECLLQAYTPSLRPVKSFEAPYESPFLELNLIRQTAAEGVYRFQVGRKETLPSEVVGFALLNFFQSHAFHRKNLSLRECLYSPGSPGQAFRLDEVTLLEHLEYLKRRVSWLFDLVETAGAIQVFFLLKRKGDVSELATSLLAEYFERTSS